jgi:hypothetical protein
MTGYQQSADVMVPPGTTVNQIVQAVLNELNRRQPATGSMTGMTPASAGPNLNPQFNFGISTPLGNVGFGWNSAQPGQGALSTQSLWGDITGFLGNEGKQILEGVGQQVAQQLPGMIGGLLKSLAASPEFAQYTQQVHAQSAGPGGALAPQFDFGSGATKLPGTDARLPGPTGLWSTVATGLWPTNHPALSRLGRPGRATPRSGRLLAFGRQYDGRCLGK